MAWVQCKLCGERLENGEHYYGRKAICYEREIAALRTQLADREAELEQKTTKQKEALRDITKAESQIRALIINLNDREEKLALWREFGKAAKTWQFTPYLTITKNLQDKGEI